MVKNDGGPKMDKSKLLYNVETNHKIDQEWVQLIIEAKNFGLTKEEIRDFLKSKKFTSDDQ